MEHPAIAPRRGAGQRTAPEEQQTLFEFLERPENRLGNNRVNFQLGVEAFGMNRATVKKIYKKLKMVRQEASLLLPDEASVATEPPSTPHCDEVARSPPTPRSEHEVEDYEYGVGGDSPVDVSEPSDGMPVPDASTEEQPVAVAGTTGTDVDAQVDEQRWPPQQHPSPFSAVEREVLLYANTIADDQGGDADPVSLPDGNAISSPIPRISAFVPEVDVASELEALAAGLEASNVYQAAMYAAQILGLETELRKERQVVLKDIYAPHEDQGVEARMCDLISSAKRGERVYALIYTLTCTSTAFAKAFKTALENGADVKLVLCRQEIKTAAAALGVLLKGVNEADSPVFVSESGSGIAHRKIIVVSGPVVTEKLVGLRPRAPVDVVFEWNAAMKMMVRAELFVLLDWALQEQRGLEDAASLMAVARLTANQSIIY